MTENAFMISDPIALAERATWNLNNLLELDRADLAEELAETYLDDSLALLAT